MDRKIDCDKEIPRCAESAIDSCINETNLFPENFMTTVSS